MTLNPGAALNYTGAGKKRTRRTLLKCCRRTYRDSMGNERKGCGTSGFSASLLPGIWLTKHMAG